MGEVTSQNLWPQYDRHFVGITRLPTKCISARSLANISQSFTHKMAAKASWHRNYVTVTLYITTLKYQIHLVELKHVLKRNSLNKKRLVSIQGRQSTMF